MAAVKKELSTNDLAAVHSQYKTHLKHSPEEAESYREANREQKGARALGWYLAKVSSGRIASSTSFVGTKHSSTKTEEWISQKQAEDAFGQDLQSYVDSGRVQWREARGVTGCYEYLDTQKFKVVKALSKTKEWGHSSKEMEPNAQGIEDFDSYFDSFLNKADTSDFLDLNEVGLWRAQEKGVAKGKGGKGGDPKGAGKGKGKKGEGEGKGGPAQLQDKFTLALMDATEEERVEICTKKAKKAVLVVKTVGDDVKKMVATYKKVKGWGKPFQDGSAQALSTLGKLESVLNSINTGGAHGNKGSEYIKDILMDAAQQCKVAQEFMKDVRRFCDNQDQENMSAVGSKRGR